MHYRNATASHSEKEAPVRITSIALAVLLASTTSIAGPASTNSGETGIFNIFTADTLDKGKFSFGIFGENLDRENKDWDTNNYSFAFAYGMSDRVELAGSWNFLTRSDPDKLKQSGLNNEFPIVNKGFDQGVGDFQVGGKLTLVSESSGSPVGFAVRAFLKLPTGDEKKGLGTGAASGGGDIILSKEMGDRGVVAFNGGITLNDDPHGIDLSHAFRVGAGVNLHLTDSFHALGEIRAIQFLDDDQGQKSPLDVSAGVEYEMSNGWAVGAMYRRNVAWDGASARTSQGAVGFVRYGQPRAPAEAPAPPPPAPPVEQAPEPPEPPAPPEAQPQPPKPLPPEITLSDVQFHFDRYDLTEEAKAVIKNAATFLHDYPDVTCTIEGHCCSIGTEEYNMALGQRRADAVRDYLSKAYGIDAARISTISYGESKPLYDNSHESTRRLNRRAHFNILIQ